MLHVWANVLKLLYESLLLNISCWSVEHDGDMLKGGIENIGNNFQELVDTRPEKVIFYFSCIDFFQEIENQRLDIG